MIASALAIMTRSTSDPRLKAPLATRIPALRNRCELALGFIDDLADRCRALPDVSLRLAVTPPVAGLRVDRSGLAGETFLTQRGASLADRQRHVFEDLAASGFTRIVLIGANIPDVPLDHLRQAFDALVPDASVVALGPTDVGGCYLIGMSVRPGSVLDDVFSPVRWNSPYAADDLTSAAARLGLSVRRLERWNRVDAPDDLDGLVTRLRHAPEAAPHTAAVLRKLGLLR